MGILNWGFDNFSTTNTCHWKYSPIVFSITLMDNVAKDLSCRKSTYPSADTTVNMHLSLPPPLGTPGIPKEIPEPQNSGKRLEDCLVASGHRDNTAVGFTGTKSPSPIQS